MIRRLFALQTDCLDPFRNLALEEASMHRVPPDAALLYLWRNEKTVVIGRNQNAWAECDVAALEHDGGRLARRSSGGGAVFQDSGNLNFTFIVPAEDYDVERQLSVVLRAVRSFGVGAEATGRNDLTAGGRKFSGNAFRLMPGMCSHHGTLMIGVDTAELGRYLRPDPAKLRGKGVASVRARVVNLGALCPAITAESIAPRLLEAFGEVYCGNPAAVSEGFADPVELEALRQKYASALWRFGKSFQGGIVLGGRFGWGGVELRLLEEGGRVMDCAVYSDALDEELIASLPPLLRGRSYTAAALCAALAGERQELRDIRGLIEASSIDASMKTPFEGGNADGSGI